MTSSEDDDDVECHRREYDGRLPRRCRGFLVPPADPDGLSDLTNS